MVVDHLDRAHRGGDGAEEGASLGLQQIEAEGDVIGGDGRCIREAGLGREAERQEVTLRGELDFACEEPVQA